MPINGWLTVAEASERTGYNREYLRRLLRRETSSLTAKKIGNQWFIEAESLENYCREMENLGTSKHNPQRSN